MEIIKITQPIQYKIAQVVYENQQNKRAFYKVKASSLGMFYGLKTIELNDPKLRRIVSNEIVALNSLPFGMSPKCHQYWQVGNKHFLLTDWIEGIPMSEFYSTPVQSKAELAQRLKVAEMLASKVADIHRHRLIHRDLKPANVIVQCARNNVQSVALIDFGLANQKRSEEEGTFQYRAPEQYLQRNVNLTPASDLFSLCQIIHWLVTAFPLCLALNFNEDDWDGLIIDLPDICPEKLQELLEKGLRFRSRERLKQVSTVASELKQVIRSLNSRSY